ncbi:hypothetical protein L9G15_24360, partial [Shewanella sp. A3A]|nr:hypothetical protein [Shewanella ferrihydritica]
FSWLLKPEADKHFFELVPSINDILFSREYLEALDKDAYLLDKCSVTVDRIKEIAQETVGQHSNEAWLITSKMRLTASKFGAVIGACG